VASRLREEKIECRLEAIFLTVALAFQSAWLTTVFVLGDLPKKWADYTQINAGYTKPASG